MVDFYAAQWPDFTPALTPGEMLAFDTFVERLSRSGERRDVLDWVRNLNGPGPLPDDFSLLTIDF